MSKTIKIGTRSSSLARWQANEVAQKLNALGYETKLVPIKSKGDLDLSKPIYEFGIIGVFTKTLDAALLSKKIDIAVHSMKDVPTKLPKDIVQGAVLPRGNPYDILVCSPNQDHSAPKGVVATSSLRRKAQWLNRYPHYTTVNLRGNINTRLNKTKESPWSGAIFAAAGLERLNMLPEAHKKLDWMVPAPAQGAIMATAKENDLFSLNALSKLNNKKAHIETHIERQFLNALEGGCSAPVGALSRFDQEKEEVDFKGVLLSLNGGQKLEIKKTIPKEQFKKAGLNLAQKLLRDGGKALMQEFYEERKR